VKNSKKLLHTLKTNTKVVRDKHNKARRLISIVVPKKELKASNLENCLVHILT